MWLTEACYYYCKYCLEMFDGDDFYSCASHVNICELKFTKRTRVQPFRKAKADTMQAKIDGFAEEFWDEVDKALGLFVYPTELPNDMEWDPAEPDSLDDFSDDVMDVWEPDPNPAEESNKENVDPTASI